MNYSKFYTQRLFTSPGQDPFTLVHWEKRDVSMQAEDGTIIFEQRGVEVPSNWSENAVAIVAEKYFGIPIDSNARESSVRQLIARVVDVISRWGLEQGYLDNAATADNFRGELSYILLSQRAAFNSPVWFNVGIEQQPQCSACFILSVDDTLESLLELQKTEGRIFKFGSGSGTNLSSIRSTKERLKGGGAPAGPVAFMRAYDSWAHSIGSGGKVRRAAKMQILNVTHPDILEFVSCKAKEERKLQKLVSAGLGENRELIAEFGASLDFQNSNLSVRVTDEFMQAIESDSEFTTIRVIDGKPCEKLSARKVMEVIVESALVCGDPGLQFDTTINAWHTTPSAGRINASNPCAEYLQLDNSSCNLASINLVHYVDQNGAIRLHELLHTVELLIASQDMLIDRASYPTPEVASHTKDYRQLGLGFTNLGATLMRLGWPYDSKQGRDLAALTTAFLTGQAYKVSALLAKEKGSFSGYNNDRDAMLKVIEKHRGAAHIFPFATQSVEHISEVRELWDEVLELGKQYGFRNSQVSVIAPAGTISFMMDCDTTGIEPDTALLKRKHLHGGAELLLVNRSVAVALKALSYDQHEIIAIIQHLERRGYIEDAPGLSTDDLAVFDCAFSAGPSKRRISALAHLEMVAAVQPFISGGISKTVNLPASATAAEIFEIYLKAWKLGLKAISVYRDGTKALQPLESFESE